MPHLRSALREIVFWFFSRRERVTGGGSIDGYRYPAPCLVSPYGNDPEFRHRIAPLKLEIVDFLGLIRGYFCMFRYGMFRNTMRAKPFAVLLLVKTFLRVTGIFTIINVRGGIFPTSGSCRGSGDIQKVE